MKNIKEEIIEIIMGGMSITTFGAKEMAEREADQILSLISSRLPKEKELTLEGLKTEEAKRYLFCENGGYNTCLNEIKQLLR